MYIVIQIQFIDRFDIIFSFTGFFRHLEQVEEQKCLYPHLKKDKMVRVSQK